MLREIGLETLNVDIESEAASLEGMTMERLQGALREAFKAGHAMRQKESIEANLLFWQLMESLPDHVYFKDLRSRFTCINHSLARFFGLSNPDEAIGKSDFDFFQNEFAATKFDAEQAIIRSGRGWHFREERDIQNDGSEKWVLTTKLPLRDLNGDICGTFGISRDITKRKIAEIELDRQRQLLETIIQILPCRIFARDTEGRFLLTNEEYRNTFHIDDRENVIG